MLFKDIKQNYPIYLLDKDNKCFIIGKVTGTTFPHAPKDEQQQSFPGGMPNYAPQNYNNYNNRNQAQRMVVDLTIEAGDRTATYEVSENASVNYAGNLILATEKQLLVPEMEAMVNNANDFLATIDQRKADAEDTVKKMKAILAEVSPQFRQAQEYDQRFNKIEGSVNELKDLMTNFIKEFKS